MCLTCDRTMISWLTWRSRVDTIRRDPAGLRHTSQRARRQPPRYRAPPSVHRHRQPGRPSVNPETLILLANLGRPRRPRGASAPHSQPVLPDPTTAREQLSALISRPVTEADLPTLRRVHQLAVEAAESLFSGEPRIARRSPRSPTAAPPTSNSPPPTAACVLAVPGLVMPVGTIHHASAPPGRPFVGLGPRNGRLGPGGLAAQRARRHTRRRAFPRSHRKGAGRIGMLNHHAEAGTADCAKQCARK
jgi:hypothetical protein